MSDAFSDAYAKYAEGVRQLVQKGQWDTPTSDQIAKANATLTPLSQWAANEVAGFKKLGVQPYVAMYGHNIEPWDPAWGPFPVQLNGVTVDPTTYFDDGEFRDDYTALVEVRKKTPTTGLLTPDQAKAWSSAITKVDKRVHDLNTDPGRWIIQHEPISAFINALASGESVSDAYQALGSAFNKNLQDVGPYIQTVISFIPGWGQIAAAAIGAAIALSRGEPIDQGLIDAIGGALPGGAATAAALRAGDAAVTAAVKGEQFDQAMFETVQAAIPPGAARAAFGVGAALVGASLAQSDPRAAQVLMGQASKDPLNKSTAALPPPAHTPTAAEAANHAQTATTAYQTKQPPPAPPWPKAQSGNPGSGLAFFHFPQFVRAMVSLPKPL